MSDSSQKPDLEISALRKEYPGPGERLVVLSDLQLALDRGQSLAIMGPSGSGKTTLLQILGVLEPPTSGRVRILGQDPYALSETEAADFRNRHIGFIFQDHYLLPQCSALENVLIPTLPRRAAGGGMLERARQLLGQVGLSNRMDEFPATLSGGERQRVAIARALINAPEVLLCDEPTGNLDRANGDLIGQCFLELVQRERVALVVVTHNERFAALFDRSLLLTQGRLMP